ncbi:MULTISPECIES: hypothetical protein [Rhizobium]|uniref:Uncharacterized protein n=1 Tax=Rhizobium paranaense TaxID=1650438 RepID=A0A7W8XVJ0_9HYPH|nr:hypothetical protein [Rhizobium paranaense]MBB5576144.1 hypothetical protein [Rhizobium paranaense]
MSFCIGFVRGLVGARHFRDFLIKPMTGAGAHIHAGGDAGCDSVNGSVGAANHSASRQTRCSPGRNCYNFSGTGWCSDNGSDAGANNSTRPATDDGTLYALDYSVANAADETADILAHSFKVANSLAYEPVADAWARRSDPFLG